jgi:Transposase IS116/IS110/IS902 family
VVLGSRVVAEFGDDPTRSVHPKARKNYAGTAPITRACGNHQVVVARLARNRRLADACYQWAFSALTASPGARAHYDRCRVAGTTIPRPYGPWPTAWSASCTAAYATALAPTKPRPGRALPRTLLDTHHPWGV